MKENYTHISIILDKSGSMLPVKDDVIGSFNSLVEKLEKETNKKVTLSLHTFNEEYNTIYSFVLPVQAMPLNCGSYTPSGLTALLDAIGITVNNLGKKLSNMPEKEKPSKVNVTIITDGLENASKAYSRDKVFEMIKHQREKYSWEFVFIGANQDAIATASSLSISPHNTLNYESTTIGTRNAFDIYALGLVRSVNKSEEVDKFFEKD